MGRLEQVFNHPVVFELPTPKAEGIKATIYQWRDPRTIPPRPWLFRRHFIRGFITATAGPAGGAKSSIELVDVLSMVVGRDLLSGHALPTGPLRVWLYNTEDPREEIERRIAAVCLHYNVAAEDIGDRLYLDTAREQKLVVAVSVDGHAVTAPGVIADIVSEVRERGIDAFVADPLIHTHTVSENDNTGMAEVMAAWREVAERACCCVELIHHIRKNRGEDTTNEDMRGAVAILGAVRSLRLISTMSGADARQFGIAEDQRRFHVWANPTGKPSLVPPASRRYWYQLRSVDLGNATDTLPSDLVGVATRWVPPDAFEDVSLDDARRCWAAIHDANPLMECRASTQATGWVGKLVARELGLDIEAPGVRGQIVSMVATWTRNGILTETTGRDGRARRDVPLVMVRSVREVCDEGADAGPI